MIDLKPFKRVRGISINDFTEKSNCLDSGARGK